MIQILATTVRTYCIEQTRPHNPVNWFFYAHHRLFFAHHLKFHLIPAFIRQSDCLDSEHLTTFETDKPTRQLSASALLNRATLHLEQDRPAAALPDFERALDLAPLDWDRRPKILEFISLTRQQLEK